MKVFVVRAGRALLWLGLGLFALVALVALAAMLTLPEWAGDLNLVIDGERIDLGGLSAGHGVSIAFGLAVAAVVAAVALLLVLPFTLLVGLGVPALIVAAVFLGLVALAALLLSPLLLAAWLLWWLLKPSPQPTTIDA